MIPPNTGKPGVQSNPERQDFLQGKWIPDGTEHLSDDQIEVAVDVLWENMNLDREDNETEL